jgi:hypothetical protein
MIVARLRLAPAEGTAGSPRVPPSPSCSRQAALGRARHVGRGNGNPFNRLESDQ